MPGQVVHLEIPAQDTRSAREFWGGLFGWEWQQFEGPSEYHMTRIDDRSGAAIMALEGSNRVMRPYLAVDDIRAGATRVGELGGDAGVPMPVPGMGWFAVCHDNQGNEFGLWQNDPSAQVPNA
jgi:uncharacterized protein